MPDATNGQHEDPDAELGPVVPGPAVRQVPLDALAGLDAGDEWTPDPRDVDAVGRTMFDAPGSKDNALTVLLPRDSLNHVPAQSLLRIESREDNRTYLGIVTAGPFAEPDGLRADAPTIVTTAVRGATAFVPRYHGRVQVEILGERRSGALSPPRYRPLPNSPVFLLDSGESGEVLALGGNLQLGVVAAGDDSLTINIPADKKSVLPRHTGVLGTTGGGKSTTVSRMIDQAQRQGFAVILLDTEGEYTTMNEPTEDPTMLKLLAERGEEPHGVENTKLYTLAGKHTSNPLHPAKAEFDLRFERFSPYVVEELLELTEAQTERYSHAYEAAKSLLRELGIFPASNSDEERRAAMELNDFESGYPRMKLDHVLDVVRAVVNHLHGDEPPHILSSDFRSGQGRAKLIEKSAQIAGRVTNKVSWRALSGHLHRLRRLQVFDSAQPISYDDLLKPGSVSIFDLSDTDSPAVNNLVIADVLRGVQDRQDEAYRASERGGSSPTRVLVIIEEAHEFLSDERISKMPFLFQQVARIAKRGRKRWLGLVFVTQLPRHLPPQVLGLVNNWILHRISDADTVSRLRRSVANVDDSLWLRLPGLAPGQAIVSFTSMTRPLLAAIDPTPAKLRMLD
jgi:DNA helicase HerA-like ATPase